MSALGDLLGNAAEGVHVAAAGGVWMALVYGFGGMTQRDGHLHVEPRLPSEWSRLAFRVQVQESRLLVEITHEAVSTGSNSATTSRFRTTAARSR